MAKYYRYVGPPEIMTRTAEQPEGTVVASPADVTTWAEASGLITSRGGTVPATFVIDPRGRLRIADRHSEHVACAGGGDVLSAGEMFFEVEGKHVRVAEVSNQSTGFCPEPESWEGVESALDRAGIGHPGGFTTACVFRRCEACSSRNIVKDGWFHCDVCGARLPDHWNFD